jgi:hypothetical protein
MVNNFDYWAVVDGLSQAGGSTRWCNTLKLPASSTDGTTEFMTELASKHKNVLFYSASVPFKSKDEQVNRAIDMIRTKVRRGWLWQVDADEHWDIETIETAEQKLLFSSSLQMSFKFRHFVGDGLVAEGDWGSGSMCRLFRWRGQKFITHEPPMMFRREKTLESQLSFDHYSYYFENDVAFKEKYYKGYQGILHNWYKLQTMKDFPQPISVLLPPTATGYGDHTKIVKI